MWPPWQQMPMKLEHLFNHHSTISGLKEPETQNLKLCIKLCVTKFSCCRTSGRLYNYMSKKETHIVVLPHDVKLGTQLITVTLTKYLTFLTFNYNH